MFFIVGLPRSGTTLLSSILSSSEMIQVTSEIWFFNYWKDKYDFLDLANQKDLLFFLEKFLGSKRFTDLGVSETELREIILSDDKKWNFKDIFSTCMELFRIKEGVEVVGEKTPGQYKKIGELLETYPEARIICMMRDPRAVASSLVDAPFGSNFVSVTARRWEKYTRLITRLTRDHDRLLIVRYEDLVVDVHQELERIRSFMKWPDWEFKVDADRAAHFKVERKDEWSQEHFKRANSPISTDNVNKWQKKLGQEQIAIVEAIALDQMTEHGYTTSGIAISRAKKQMIVRSDRIASRVAFAIKQPNKLRRFDWFKKMTYRLTGDIHEKH